MEEQKGFIGMGHNPDPNVPDIPLGFGIALLDNAAARNFFENLSDEQKTKVIDHIHDNNATGYDAKRKIEKTIENLENGNINFI